MSEANRIIAVDGKRCGSCVPASCPELNAERRLHQGSGHQQLRILMPFVLAIAGCLRALARAAREADKDRLTAELAAERSAGKAA